MSTCRRPGAGVFVNAPVDACPGAFTEPRFPDRTEGRAEPRSDGASGLLRLPLPDGGEDLFRGPAGLDLEEKMAVA